jgi:hypothetical protein
MVLSSQTLGDDPTVLETTLAVVLNLVPSHMSMVFNALFISRAEKLIVKEREEVDGYTIALPTKLGNALINISRVGNAVFVRNGHHAVLRFYRVRLGNVLTFDAAALARHGDL